MEMWKSFILFWYSEDLVSIENQCLTYHIQMYTKVVFLLVNRKYHKVEYVQPHVDLEHVALCIVENNILRTSWVYNLGVEMATFLYSSVLWYKSFYLCLSRYWIFDNSICVLTLFSVGYFLWTESVGGGHICPPSVFSREQILSPP